MTNVMNKDTKRKSIYYLLLLSPLLYLITLLRDSIHSELARRSETVSRDAWTARRFRKFPNAILSTYFPLTLTFALLHLPTDSERRSILASRAYSLSSELFRCPTYRMRGVVFPSCSQGRVLGWEATDALRKSECRVLSELSIVSTPPLCVYSKRHGNQIYRSAIYGVGNSRDSSVTADV